jgi:hypothetical protein
MVKGTLTAAGVTEVTPEITQRLAAEGVLLRGLEILGNGGVLSGIVLAAATVFIIDHQLWRAAAFAAAGSVLTFFGFIATVDDGLLHACVIRDASPFRRFTLFNRAERGRHVGSPEVELLTDRSFSVRFPADGPAPRFEIDGDVYASRGHTVDVELIPRALEVVVV